MIEMRDLSLFGIDLRSGWRYFARGWREALAWPALAWLSPKARVRLLQPDGGEQWRQGASAQSIAPGREGDALAVLLPDDLTLTRTLVLPDLDGEDLDAALALQVESLSPFGRENTVFGARVKSRADGMLDVFLAMASREHVASYLAGRPALSAAPDPEVWCAGGADPVVIRGYGEGRRERAQARMRGWILVSIGVLVIALLALAATPFMLLRSQALEAQIELAKISGETQGISANREQLVKTVGRVAAIKARLDELPELPRLIDTLTHVIPDDTYLNRLEISGRQVRMAGFSQNASGLIEMLGTRAEFVDVKTPSAIARGRDGWDTFSVEFMLRSGAPK